MKRTHMLRPFAWTLLVILGLATTAATLPPVWERLAIRKVNFLVDRDELLVTGREGIFTALQFRVKGAPINMHRCVVHYRNGDTQEIELRENFPAGGQSRVIDLKGNHRIITKVVIVYDTKNMAGRRATLELWGRH
ncbi:MAG: hypothetical protein SF053_02810 [Bacteroidia bacterium]|nr:hypothetical protein [Bacteroidia bacterium]